MELQFEKMHGLGNDFIVLDAFSTLLKLPGVSPASDDEAIYAELAALAPALCDRNFGIGADGVIAVMPSTIADLRMFYVNADGSVSGMCGNGVRCVGKFAYEHGLLRHTEMSLETGSGVVRLELSILGGLVDSVGVDMGIPNFDAASLPAVFPGGAERLVEGRLAAGGESFIATCLSIGNPHCVRFIEEAISIWDYPVTRIGPMVENAASIFPERVNAEFAKVIAPDAIDLRVWERGCGETLACGSGACATVAAAVVTGRVAPDTSVAVRLPGGTLEISYSGKDGEGIKMFGPAVSVFTGVVDPKSIALNGRP